MPVWKVRFIGGLASGFTLLLLAFVVYSLIRQADRYIMWFMLFVIAARFVETFCANTDWALKTEIEDRPLGYVVYSYILFVTVCLVEHHVREPGVGYLSVLGVGLFLVAVVVRLHAMRALGRSWSISSFKTNDHFVSRGPYAVMRHPYYFGVLLEVLSIALVLNSYTGLILGVFLVIPLEIKRACFEDAVLAQKFGMEHENYRKRTRGFLPFLGRKQ